MRFVNYCLGATAHLNVLLARLRINGIPLNGLLMVAIGIYGAVLWVSALDAIANSHSPLPVSIDQIMTNQGLTQNYVSVSGWSVPVAVYEYASHDRTGKATSVSESWSPLIDLKSSHVLLVRHDGAVSPGAAHLATVTGMLRSLHAEVRHQLADHGNEISGQLAETRYALVEGDHPGDSASSIAAATFVSLVFACFCVASFRRNTIFQEEGGSLAPTGALLQPPIPVTATGRFALNADDVQRFVDMPGVLALERGNPVIQSHIDATNRFMGMPTRERCGVWRIFVNPSTVKDGRFGFLYFGFSQRRRAFQFRYADPKDGKYRKAVIATEAPDDVLAGAALLTGSSHASAGC